MNINLPSFNMKNFIKEAGNSISRAVQLTEEKLGTTERTEYDAEFQSLAEHADITKIWTEKILKNTESVLVPNPQNRIEDFIYEKFDKTKRHRLSNLEHLALDMLEAGGDFGQDLPYGQALIKVGQAEQRLGRCERDFIGSSSACFTEPLRKFLDGDMKIITKERGILESKRLDLDACKNRVKKARSMLGQQAKDGISPEAALEQAERDLRVAQSEFDRQSELTKTLLESISMSHNDHLRHLYAFVEAQVRYYKQCMDVMDNLQNELASMRPEKPRLRINSQDIDGGPSNHEIQQKHEHQHQHQHQYQQQDQQMQVIDNNAYMKSLASYCQYDSVDLDNLEDIDINNDDSEDTNDSNTNINVQRTVISEATDSVITSSQLLDEYNLQYDTTAITSV